jgi:hypothetical protein
VRERLQQGRKVVLLGLGKLTEDLVLYDVFGLNLDNVVAMIDERSLETELQGIEEHSSVPDKKFYHLPRLRREDMASLDYDTAVVCNLTKGQLAKLYGKHFLTEAADKLVTLAPIRPLEVEAPREVKAG